MLLLFIKKERNWKAHLDFAVYSCFDHDDGGVKLALSTIQIIVTLDPVFIEVSFCIPDKCWPFLTIRKYIIDGKYVYMKAK